MTPEEIKALRQELSCTARELAGALDLEQDTVLAWEKGEQFPTKRYVDSMEDLRGGDGEDLFERLCAMDGRRHDPCLLDTFMAAVDFANGAPARLWWEYSRERLARSGV